MEHFNCPLVLASSSPFRKSLLERLKIPFVAESPQIDETRKKGESPEDLAKRLSIEKAKALKEKYPKALIIGSDQVATLNGKIYGKPGNKEAAFLQLQELSGNTVEFLSGVALLNTHTQHLQVDCVVTKVLFRVLDESTIQNYLTQEPESLLCAGAAKSEGLGITLLEKIESNDPTALIGLPLIALCQMLRNEKIL